MILFEMTFSGGVMILLIVIIRALAIDRLPKRLFLALWGATLLRLLVPFSIPFQFSLFSLAERGAYAVDPSAVIMRNGEIARMVLLSEPSIQRASDGVADLWTVLWLTGLALAVLFFAVAYVRHLRRFRYAKPVINSFISGWLASCPLRRTVSIRESGSVTAPLTYGIFQPVILVPVGTDWEDSETLNYAFAHEYTHIHRFDALLRLLLMAALCVHWFNPLVWVMYILALRDIELSCDEAVVRRFGFESRRGYALALLKMEETRRHFNAFASGFSKNAAEERLRAIMRLRETTAFRTIVSAALVIGISATLCTSAVADSGTLMETPNLIYTSMEYITVGQHQIPRGRLGSDIWLREGDFIKLQLKGRGEGTFGFFLCCEKTGEGKGRWLTLDGSTHELWLEIPADGDYYIWVPRDYQYVSGTTDCYTYTVNYNCYYPNGEQKGARYHRQDMFRGYLSETYTYTRD